MGGRVFWRAAGTPADRINWHHREWTTVLKEPRFADLMQKTFAFDVVASTPQVLLDQIRRELVANARIVKQHNITE